MVWVIFVNKAWSSIFLPLDVGLNPNVYRLCPVGYLYSCHVTSWLSHNWEGEWGGVEGYLVQKKKCLFQDQSR